MLLAVTENKMFTFDTGHLRNLAYHKGKSDSIVFVPNQIFYPQFEL